ncbi:MAG TPA: S53 family peptidase [Actinocrinis sp.]|nr:S53 family peptidase [Actinocrinis sp.]
MVPKIFSRPGARSAAALPAAMALAGAFALAGPVASAAAATVAVPGTQPAWATASAQRGAVAAGTPVTTTVYLAGQDQAAMTAYATAVATPGSASYHHYLSAAQFQARFGTTAAQVKAVTAWLQSAGLKVVGSNGQSVTVAGTAAQTEAAYGTRLDDYAVQGKIFRGPTGDAQVPTSVAGSVISVVGLDDAPVTMKPASLVGQESTAAVAGLSKAPAEQSTGADGSTFLGPTPCSAYYGQAVDTTEPAINGSTDNPYTVCGYVPAQVRGAYGVTATGLTGKGVTVAIVDAYGSPTIEADADQYATNHGDKPFGKGQFSQTVTPAQWIDQDECQGAAGWAPEETLDVEAVHAMAPGAKVHYYGANSCNDPDWLSVFKTIVNTHSADLVSDSWGGVVYSTTGNEDPAVEAEYNQVFIQGAIEGIGFNFSSGDCGAEDPATGCGNADTSTTPQADFPTSDPYVTSVGGTSLAIGKNNQQLWNTAWGTDAWVEETAGTWTDFGWQYGGGGGTSGTFSQPWYQKGVVSKKLAETLPSGTATTSPMRVAPDVSMDADPTTGFLSGMTQSLPDGSIGYGESDIGGTSLACPLFVGLQADAMQGQFGIPVGFANPAIYAAYGSPAYTDVTDSGPGLKAYNMIPQDGPYAPAAFDFGDDQLLKATKGYDDATGVGTPSPWYLLLHAW